MVKSSKSLTLEKFEQILVKTIFRVQGTEKINVIELIEEIKQHIINEKEKSRF